MKSAEAYYRNRYAELEGLPFKENRTFDKRIRKILEMMPSFPQRVLDFGCHVGRAAASLREAGYEVVGVDLSESAVRSARKNVPEVPFEVIPSENKIPFPDESFDTCIATEVIEHLFDVSGFLREIHRILVPGGSLLITTPDHGWLKNFILITCRFEKHFSPLGQHIRFFSKRSLTECLEKEGFQIEKLTGLGRLWPVWQSLLVKSRKISSR